MVGLGEIFGGLSGVFIIISLWIWQGSRSMWSNYGESFEDMKKYRASKFRNELHDILVDVLDDIDLVKYQTSPSRDELVVMDALESVNRESLTDVEDALREYDEPNELIDDAEDSYNSAFKYLISSAFISGLLAIISVSMSSGPSRYAWQVVVAGVLLYASASGIQSWYSAWQCEKKVDRYIRAYKDDY